MDDEQALISAAAAIDSATHLLIAAGAGFSADSGLPVYADVAHSPMWSARGLDYSDLCRPHLLSDSPAVGYGFWAGCTLDYLRTEPHDGYRILERWAASKSPDVVYVYTSNVDGHFRRFPGLAHSLCEIHGCAEDWVCGASMDVGVNVTGPCATAFVRPSLAEIDRFSAQCTAAMAAEECGGGGGVSGSGSGGGGGGGGGNDDQVDHWSRLPPTCVHCGSRLRPSVLMFGDDDQLLLARLAASSSEYQAWEDAMETCVASDPSLRLVVLELGCGLRVPSVRLETESVVRDALERGAQATLVRINPDERTELPAAVSSQHGATPVPQNLIVLRQKALSALRRIDTHIRARAAVETRRGAGATSSQPQTQRSDASA
jgi:NAD-dependent SIR2 family protein deacetylase